MNYSLDDLLYLMARLRDPVDGCPWDRAQSFETIAPYTIEECYELADAIANKDREQIREELGDVLFQVTFYSQLGAEDKSFTFNDIVSSLVDKLVRRHPHVFPDNNLRARFGQQTADLQNIANNWEEIKTQERNDKQLNGILDDIPQALPALTRAAKLQKRASKVGFDWASYREVAAKLHEELAELDAAKAEENQPNIEDELGDVLFSVVNMARHLKIDPEQAMTKANRKFEKRFRYIEQSLQMNGVTTEQASLDHMDSLWQEAKDQGL